jgi:RNA polymerase sigma-70 factor (ECF subfamily)
VGTYDHLADEQLLALTPREPAAFDVFYLRHERLVLGWVRRRTPSPEVAIDVTGETFVAALASVRRYRPAQGPAVAWLLGVARHKLLRSYERGEVEARARRRVGTPRIEVFDEALERVDQLGSWSADELLAYLPVAEAEAVRARVIDQLDYGTLAERLRCSPLVARKRVSRGLQSLRTLVESDDV